MKNYNKQALSINDQINLLQSRGLVIKDINYTKSVLEKLNYYNFSGYTYIFEGKSNINNLYDMINNILSNKILKNKPLINDIGIPNNWKGGLFFI